MKIKSIACLFALAAASAYGTVAVESANEFGVLKVTCDSQKAIIATPWVKCGDANASVKVTDLVMTAGLENGDAIIVYQGSSFKAWAIANGSWTPTPIVDGGTTYSAGDAASAAVARGEAFWFVKSAFTSGSTYDLYLYGQKSEAAATATVTANAYSLIASPSVADTDMNSVTFSFTPNAADEIQVPNADTSKPPTSYTYKSGKWGAKVKTPIGTTGQYMSKWTAGCTIPAGRGFWYISKGGSGTITW